MGTPRFTPEFKEEAVHQITERDYSVADVSDRLVDSASGQRVDGTYWPGKVKMSVHESKSE
jgi:hypothetical protein